MTDVHAPAPTPGAEPAGPAADGTATVAKEQAAHLGEEAAVSTKKVAGVAKEEAAGVAGEAKRQAKDLIGEARNELVDQARVQQERVASGLRSAGDELSRMAESSEQPGIAAELVSQLASRTDRVATWLDQRDPGSLIREVKGFARERPGTFIAIAAAAGILAGRLTRNVVGETTDPEETLP
jgi:ElaB/YqjD/DUF883 family membrane-anchored ribosome-binding protein